MCRIKLTDIQKNNTIKSEHLFVLDIERGNKIMTDHEKELIQLIRENDNPEKALMTATVIILDFLRQHESSEEPSAVYLREPC
jgi:hypothetical protein